MTYSLSAILPLAVAWTVVLGSAHAANAAPAPAQILPGLRGVPVKTDGAPYGFAEYVPKRYLAKPATACPLVISLHGMGQGGPGTSPEETLRQTGQVGALGLIQAGKPWFDAENAVCVNPVTPEWWNAEMLDGFVDVMLKRYRIDPDRVYILGCSMGGAGTVVYVQKFGERIAACMPDAVAWNPFVGDGAKFVTVPTWFFHAWGDTVCPIFANEVGKPADRSEPYPHGNSTLLWVDEVAGWRNGSQQRTVVMESYPNKGSFQTSAPGVFTASLDPAKGWRWAKGVDSASAAPVKFTLYPDGGHGHNPGWQTAEVWQWMFAQRRGGAADKGAKNAKAKRH